MASCEVAGAMFGRPNLAALEVVGLARLAPQRRPALNLLAVAAQVEIESKP